MNATFVQNRCNYKELEGNLRGKGRQITEPAYGSWDQQQKWNFQRWFVLVNATVFILKDALIYYLLDRIK